MLRSLPPLAARAESSAGAGGSSDALPIPETPQFAPLAGGH